MLINIYTIIRNYIKKNSILVKICTSYLIIGMILSSVFSYLLLQKFSKNTIDEINTNSENMISQSYNTADLLLTSTYTNFYNMYNTDTNIFNALYSTDLSSLEVADVCDTLRKQVNSNTIINSIYIYNRKFGKVFTSLTSESNIDEFFDVDAIKMIDNYDDYNKTFIPRSISYKYLERNYHSNFISILYYNVNRDSAIESAMVINIDQDVFQKLLTSSKDNGTNKFFIIDNNGTVISHSDPKLLNSTLIKVPYVSKILSSKDKQGYFTNNESKETSTLVNYVKSGTLGWTFITTGEYKNLLSNFKSVKNYVILITLIFIIIGLVVAAYFTTNIYRPFYNLLTDIKSKNDHSYKTVSMNEYDYMKSTFHNLFDNNAKLESNIQEYSSARKNELLVQILNGESSRFINNEVLTHCGIHLNSDFYCVVILKFDSFINLYTIYDVDNLALLRYALLNISNEILGKAFSVEGVDDDLDHVSLIINLKNDSPSLMATLKLLLEEIHSNIQKFLKLSITSAIGTVVIDYKSIHISYLNAIYATRYRLISGKNTIILYSDVADRKSIHQNYPYDIEKQLIAALKQGNEEKSEVSLDSFFEYLGNNNPDEILMSLSQLMSIIVRTLNNIESSNMENTDTTFINLFEELKTIDTLPEMKEYIRSSLTQIVDYKSSSGNTKKQHIVNTLTEYIDSNFCDPNICVETIAAKVGLSVNYVRSIFKETTNKSISDYLIELRLKKAQELLLTTDYTAKKISEMIGYTYTRYFYVVFKKYTGKTADEFRKGL